MTEFWDVVASAGPYANICKAKSSQQQYKLFKARCTASIRQKFFALDR